MASYYVQVHAMYEFTNKKKAKQFQKEAINAGYGTAFGEQPESIMQQLYSNEEADNGSKKRKRRKSGTRK